MTEPTGTGLDAGVRHRAHAFGSARKLHGKPAFDRVFASAEIKLRRHPFLLLAIRRSTGPARLGLVVGKRHARQAVDRNRIRRHARESFRQFPFDGAYDVVLLAQSGAGDCTDTKLTASLQDLWARLDRQPGPLNPALLEQPSEDG